MKRLTETLEKATWINDKSWVKAREPDDEEINNVYLKLMRYEDTGLEPEEIKEYGWIPIIDHSSLLPAYDGEYEVTVETLPGYNRIEPGVIHTMRMIYVSNKWKSEWFQEIPYYKVIAWKELAEPYDPKGLNKQ